MNNNVEKADELAAKHHHTDAIIIYAELIKNDSNNYYLWQRMAMCKLAAGKKEKNKQLILEAFNEIKHALNLAQYANAKLTTINKDLLEAEQEWEKYNYHY